MFDIFFRLYLRTEGLKYTDYEYNLILRDRGKANLLASLILFTLFIIPIAIMGTSIIVFDESIKERFQLIVMFIAYLFFVIWLVKKFGREVRAFEKLIEDSIYSNKHTLKGNAISPEEFEYMRQENPDLYSFITSENCRGNCYQVCFDILKTLETGYFLLAAVHRSSGEKTDNKYTMHALYVNNGWCFDTYTQKQLPLKEALQLFRGKIYKKYAYQDINAQDIREFRDMIYPALKRWCQKNDCFVQMYENEP